MNKTQQTDWEEKLHHNCDSCSEVIQKQIDKARKEEREKVIMEAQFEFAGLGKMTDAEIVDRLDSLKTSL